MAVPFSVHFCGFSMFHPIRFISVPFPKGSLICSGPLELVLEVYTNGTIRTLIFFFFFFFFADFMITMADEEEGQLDLVLEINKF